MDFKEGRFLFNRLFNSLALKISFLWLFSRQSSNSFAFAIYFIARFSLASIRASGSLLYFHRVSLCSLICKFMQGLLSSELFLLIYSRFQDRFIRRSFFIVCPI